MGKQETLERFVRRIIYPSDKDFVELFSKYSMFPIFSGGLLAILSRLTMPDSTAAEMNAQNIVPVLASLLSASLTTFGMVGANLALNALFLYQRRKVRCEGTPLSINKVGVFPNALETKIFPELKNEQFFGELHFTEGLGINGKLSTNPFKTVVLGFQGLSMLASACAVNHSALEGINYFFGISPIVDKKFEKFGFQIRDPEEAGLPTNILSLPTNLTLYASMVWSFKRRFVDNREVFTRPSYACLISREDLIQNQHTLLRMSRRAYSYH